MISRAFLKKLAAFVVFLPGLTFAAPQPLAIAPADQQPFIGESFSIQLAFDNNNATDTGYGPFLDIVLPVNGSDGVAGVGTDGIDIVGGAEYLEVAVNTIVKTFPADGGGTGCVEHEFAVDNTGIPLQVCGTTGDKLVTIELPFGSFVPDQPATVVDLNLNLSNLADLGAGLALSSRAGFRFGADALNNFSSDPSIVSDVGTDPASWSGQTTVTPRLIHLTKSYSGPENETATGPNFPRQYTITVDVAPGQVVTDLDVSDFLPDNMAYLNLISTTPSVGVSMTATPTIGEAASSPDNELTVNFAEITGGTPVTVIFEYFIPRVDAITAAVINAASGDDVVSENQARAIGDWTPLDIRDAGATDNAVADPVGVEHSLSDKAIAIQKSVSVITDTGNIGEENPGDTLEYTLTFQVSDYFSLDDVVVTDIISDGQRFDSGFTPTLSMQRHTDSSVTAAMTEFVYALGGDVDERYTGATVNPTGPVDGSTLFRFRISDELASRVDASNDPRLTGGCVPDDGTGGAPADCSVYDEGPTTVTLKFRTVIQQEFSDTFPSGDESVDQGDILTNNVTVAGQLLSVVDNASVTDMDTEADTSSAEVVIAYGELSKSIYQVNGADPGPAPILVEPGDTITYRLQFTMPTSDVEDLKFIDYLPKPVFDATKITVFDNTQTATAPLAGHAHFGPNDTFGGSHGLYGAVPTLATDSAENRITISYGEYDNGDQAARNIDILFTVTVNNEPFADGLFLTNQVRATQGSTNAGSAQADAIIQIQLQEPVLEITKGISATSNSNSTISPLPGILPVDGDLSNADAADQVTFVITVENQGHAPAYDVLVTDTVPAELNNCVLGSVKDGAGSDLANSGDLFGAGLSLDNALAVSDGSPGTSFSTDTALITLVCDITDSVNPQASFDNQAMVEWTTESGAPNSFAPVSDSANIMVTDTGISKTISAIAPGYAGNLTQAQIGEEITYQLVLTVPEGVSNTVTLVDTLDNGLAFTEVVSIVASADVSTDVVGGFPAVVAAADISNAGPGTHQFDRQLTLNFGTLTNANSVDSTAETLTVTYKTRLLNWDQNNRGDTANNSAVWNWDNPNDSGTVSVSDNAPNVTMIEPELQVVKTLSAATADAGDTLTVTLDISHTGASNGDAFDVTLQDILPSGFTFAGTLSASAGVAPSSGPSEAGGTISASWNTLSQGQTAQIQFNVTVDATVSPSATVQNSAEVQWESLLEADETLSTPPVNSLAVERTGDTGDTGTTANTYIDTGSASISVPDASIVKTIDAVSPGGAGGGNLTSGDTVTYRLFVTLPEGTTNGLTLTDVLPAGLSFQSASLDTTGFSGSVAIASSSGDGQVASGETVTITFAAASTVSNDNNAGNNSFGVLVDARVEGAQASNNGLPAAQSKSNTVTLDYTGNSGTIQDSASASFVEPDLVIVKSMTPDNGLDVGSTVTITLTVTNNGSGPAHDIVVTDVLNNNGELLFDTSSVSEGSTPPGFSFGYSDPTVTYTGSGTLAAGATTDFTFTAVVRDDVITDSSFDNSASVSGDSQTGSVTGERATNDLNTDTATTGAATAGKSLIASSESWTSDTAPIEAAIGEILTYRVVFTLPEGITREDGSQPVVVDTLPAGIAYQVNTATIRAIADSGMSGSVYGPIPVVVTSINPTINGQNLEFDLGDLTNSDNDSGVEQLILEYQVLVLNSSDNNRTDTKTNTAKLNYQNSDGTAQSKEAMVSLTIVEPNLSIAKTALPASVEGGSTVTFSVVATNTSATNVTRAWESVITDPLPARYQNPSVTSATHSRGSTDVTACASFTGRDLTVDIAGGACLSAADNYLAPGETITVVYTADIDPAIVFGEQVTNTATVKASSLPGDNGTADVTPGASGDSDGERTGSGIGENDLSKTDDATVTSGQPTISKTAADTTLQIAETTLVTLTVDVPVGTTSTFEVTDDLPSGLSYTGTPIVITLPAANFTHSLSPSTTPGTGTDPLLFDFGTITNSATSAQQLTIVYEVVAENILANQNTSSLINTATLDFGGGTNPTDTETITIIEPDLEIAKTITSGASGSDAGDSISYQVSVTNNSTTATAYRVSLEDVLPAHLLGGADGLGAYPIFRNILVDNDGGTVVKTTGGGALLAGDAVFSTTTNADDTLGWELFDLPPTATLTITYEVTLHNNAVAGETLTNTITARYDSLASGGGRNSDDSNDDDDANLDNYGETDSINLIVGSSISIQKNLAATHLDNDFTIGDLITFDLRVDVVEGITPDVVITDVLPAGLSYEGPVTIIADAGFSYDGPGTAVEAPAGTISIDMGNVTNAVGGDNFFIVRVNARVTDILANDDGMQLSNAASVSSSVGNAGPDTTVIDIVEPNLVVTKTASDNTPSLGDKVTFTVEVKHDVSSADAYDVLITDLIPAGLTYVAGSLSGDGTVDENNLAQPIFNLATITLAEINKSFSFDAIVDIDAEVGAVITNQVNLDYDGQAGAPSIERSYTGSDTEDITPHIDAIIDALKTVAIVVDNGTSGVVDPGDTLEYTITLINTGTLVSGVIFADPVPVHSTYAASTLFSSKGSTDDSSDPVLLVNIGDMATNETVTITFRVTVDAGTAPGSVISNQGYVDSEQTVPEPTDKDGIDANGDQPTDIPVGGSASTDNDLYTVKLVQWKTDVDTSSDITAGDIMTYQLFMINQGNTPLTNVSLDDTIPAGLSYVNSTATISGAGNSVSVTGASVSVTIPSLAVGDMSVIEFDVTIDAFAATTQTYINQADTNSDQTNSSLSDGNAFPDDGNQPTRFAAVNGIAGTATLDLEKRVTLIVDNDGDGLTDPNDTLLYTMTLSNTGSVDAMNARLEDIIPANTTIVSGSVSTSQGIVVSEDPVNVNLGTLSASSLAVVQFYVIVDAGTTDGTVIANQAAATANGGINEPSDDNAQDADGKNPTLTPVHTHDVGTTIPPGTPELNKSLFSSSEADSPVQDVFIGEVLTYRIEGIMPVGLLKNVVITDTLPAGLSYIPGSARLSRSFDTGLTSSVDPGSINSIASGQFISLTDATDLLLNSNTVSLSLGSITNSDNDANDETYLLEFQVLVENVVTNQAGTGLSNSAVLSYLDGLEQTQNLASQGVIVIVSEPNLLIQKTADKSTLLPEGGSVNYNLVLTNPQQGHTAPAYEVYLVDVLPAEFSGMTINSITSAGGVSGITDNSSGTSLSIDVSTFPADGSLTVSFSGTAPALLTRGAVLSNTALVTGTSLPGTNGTGGVTPGSAGSASGERTGSGSVNDHRASDSVAVTVTPMIDLELSKTVNNTIPDTGSVVTFTLTVQNNGPSEASNIVITDVLANGYVYQTGTLSGGDSQNQNDPHGAGLRWTINSLPAGSSTVLAFDALVLESGNYTNSAEVSSAAEQDVDSTPGNNLAIEDDQDSVGNVIPRSVSLSVLVSCINDVSWLDYTITANGFTPLNGATIEWIDGANVVRETRTNQPLSGRLLWYGTVLDAQGKPTQWTGWDNVAGSWVKLPDFDLLRPNMVLRISVNPVNSIVVNYPSDTTVCSANPVGSIGNYIWYDSNEDGIQDAEESGIAGVNVNLLDASSNLVATTLTDGNGYYQFSKMLSSDYQVEVLAPAGYTFISANQGSGALQDSFDSDVDEVTGRTPVFTLNALDNNQTLDAGLVLDSQAPASIGDYVWYDNNANGIQDSGEPGVAGVTVQLFDSSMSLIATDVTDGSGHYVFNGLIPGDYFVDFVPSTHYVFSPLNQGSNSTVDSDADPANGRTGLIHLISNEQNSNVDAGIRIPGRAPASIGDQVWYDSDADGIRDADETGLGNVQVNLFDALDLNNVLSTTTTSADGQYSFSGLAAGNYVIGFVAPNGLNFSPDGAGTATTDSNANQQTGLTAVTALSAGDGVTDVDAGLYDPLSAVTIGDLVWLDKNQNNISDSGEGLSGVSVVLYDSFGNELMLAVTDSNGFYRFVNVNPGSYRVEVDTNTLPPGFVQISDPDESNLCLDCDSASDLINLNSTIETVDFGYKMNAVRPIPTLSEWMLIILSVLVLISGCVRLNGERRVCNY